MTEPRSLSAIAIVLEVGHVLVFLHGIFRALGHRAPRDGCGCHRHQCAAGTLVAPEGSAATRVEAAALQEGFVTRCLYRDTPCSAVADALASGETVYTRDNAGLTHAAIPLILGNRPLGALIPTPQAFR